VHPTLVTFTLSLPLVGTSTRTIGSYGVCFILALVLGFGLSIARAPRAGLSRDDVLHAGLLGLSGGLVGAAALFVALHPTRASELLAAQPSVGLVFYGGFAGALLAAWGYCRSYAVPFGALVDVAAPGLALGHAVGRIGCLLGGCCYGREVNASFPLALSLDGVPRHPVQLYEAVGLTLLGGLLLRLAGRPARPGRLFASYLALYGLLRLGTEQLRGDDLLRGTLGPLHPSEWAALLGLVLGTLAAGALSSPRDVRPRHETA
jgi:phosphatidylglycerol:prolipoprotein diacylglycerol transferase